jgi:nucleoid-associated protein YgaU
MGLFDFAKNLGNNIFGDDDDVDTASQKLQAHVEEDNPGIDDLQISVEDGVATISGEAESSSAYEKAVLMAGNALGVETVQAGELTVADQIPIEGEDIVEYTGETIDQAAGVSYYEIQKGDNLWKIAAKFYGDGTQHTKLFEENREVIKDPDKIFPGQKIRIPMDES